MRIKKKHVILEANLIDMTSEFSPQEKRLLFVLNKKYGPHNFSTFNIWDGAAFLIELFDIPYDLAYEKSSWWEVINFQEWFGNMQITAWSTARMILSGFITAMTMAIRMTAPARGMRMETA